MKQSYRIKKGIPQRVPVISRYLNIHSISGDLVVTPSDGLTVELGRSNTSIDFGSGSERGQDALIENENDQDVLVVVSFSSVLVINRDVTIEDGLKVEIEQAVGDSLAVSGAVGVNQLSPFVVESVYSDRQFVSGSIDVPASGSIELDLSGAYGFAVLPVSGVTWAGCDLSGGVSVAETEHKKLNVSGVVVGAAGTKISYWKVV